MKNYTNIGIIFSPLCLIWLQWLSACNFATLVNFKVWMTYRAFQQDQFTFPWTSKALLMCHCIMIITRSEVYKTVFSFKIYDKVLIFERLLDIDQLVISRLLLVHKMCVYFTDCTVCPCIVFRQEVSRDRLRPAKVSGRSGNNRKYGTALHIVIGIWKGRLWFAHIY